MSTHHTIQHATVADIVSDTEGRQISQVHPDDGIAEIVASLKKFNSLVKTASRIIQRIVAEQISDYFNIPYNISLTIYVCLETDINQTIFKITKAHFRYNTFLFKS